VSTRDRATELIGGLVRAAVAAQEARTVEGIFRIAVEKLGELGLSATFYEVRAGGEEFIHLDSDGFFREVADVLAERRGPVLPLAAAPVQQAIQKHPDGVLIDNLRPILAQALGKPLAELGLATNAAAVGAAIPVGGKIEFTVTASGLDLDSSLAPAFGLFARQLGHAIETSRRLEELAGSNRELMIINQVARAATQLGSGRSLEGALSFLARSLGIDGIALFRREANELVLAVHAGMPEAWVAQSGRVPRRQGQGVSWSEAAPGEGPRHFSMREQIDAVAIPLHTGKELQGVLIATRADERFTGYELRLLTTVGAQFAVSLQNELLFQQSQQRIRELSLMLELGQAVSSSLDQREILNKGVQVTARVLGCSAAYIFLPDEHETSLACVASEDPLSAIAHDVRLPLDKSSISALAFHTGKPQQTDDTLSDPRVDASLNEVFGCRSTLAVPLRSRDKTLGVLVLIERVAEHAFEAQDLRLAIHAAQLLASSVANAGLYAEQRRRAEEMTLLNEAARSLAGSLDVEPLLAAAAETLRKLLDASHCVIWLLDRDRQMLKIHAAPPGFPSLLGMTVPLDSPSAVSVAINAKGPVQITDAFHSTLVRGEMVRMFNTPTLLSVPLIARDEAVGAVVIADARLARRFSPAEIERATAVAGQIAMAIITARLIEDLRRSYTELELAQTERVDRERLAVLGELSASIAHEVRNPLGVIFNALGSLKRMLKPEGNVGLLLGIIGEEADRLNRMVGDLLDYSRPYKPSLSPVLLEPLVADAIGSAYTQSGRTSIAPSGTDEGLRVELRIPKDLMLRADQRLLRQALINLFLNALQAMPKGGSLDVIAERVEGPRGPEAWLRIRDSGPGIPEFVRARVFHPFFTTKATGTGLGLAVVKRIIDGHGGRIGLSGGDETGAVFELWLPMEGE
jgi:signal transduction histidine kinase